MSAVAELEVELKEAIKNQLAGSKKQIGYAFFLLERNSGSYKVSVQVDGIGHFTSVSVFSVLERGAEGARVIKYRYQFAHEVAKKGEEGYNPGYRDQQEEETWTIDSNNDDEVNFFKNYIIESGLTDELKAQIPIFEKNHSEIVAKFQNAKITQDAKQDAIRESAPASPAKMPEQAMENTIEANIVLLKKMYEVCYNTFTHREFDAALQSTQDYKSCVQMIKDSYKKIEGSPKQIAWAEKIRNHQTRMYAYELTYAKFMKISGERPRHYNRSAESPIQKYFVPESYDYDESLKKIEKRYSFVTSSSAREIIDEEYTHKFHMSAFEMQAHMDMIHDL